MFDVIMENVVKVLTALLLAGINIGGAYLLKVIGKNQNIKAIYAATQSVIELTAVTCGELQQTLVANLKAANEDGKLTKEDIAYIQDILITKVDEKLTQPVFELIHASGSDLEALILGAAEAWVNGIKTAKEAA